MSDEQTTEEAWREVGEQFQALGQSLAQAFRTAWGSEANRRHLESVKDGLAAMVGEVDQAIREASTSAEGQKVRQEAKRAAASARAAGEKALQEVQPHLLSALNQVNAELHKVIDRMEQREAAPETHAAEETPSHQA